MNCHIKMPDANVFSCCFGPVYLLLVIVVLLILIAPKLRWDKHNHYILNWSRATVGYVRHEIGKGFVPVIVRDIVEVPLKHELSLAAARSMIERFWQEPKKGHNWLAYDYYDSSGKKVVTLVKVAGAYAPVLLENGELPKDLHIVQDDLYPEWVAMRLAQAMVK